jgi:microcystin-dependent protein
MARNGSGTYSKVNTFVSGNTITAAGHNQNWDDLVSEMTNSVAADGQTTMTGPLKAASGTVSAPGVTFASDPDCGLYRIGANNIGVAVNGAKVIDVATTGAAVTGTLSATGAISTSGTLSATGVISQGGFALLPVGAVFPYAGGVAPSGYLFCYGQSLLRADYPDLFTAIGTQYGAVDGTHFSLPDLRGRVVAGQDDMGGVSANRLTNADDGLDGDTLGAAGGGETQSLVTGNLPAQTPAGTVAITAINHSVRSSATGGISEGTSLANGNTAGTLSTPNGLSFVSGTATFTGTAFAGQTSTAFGIVQPTFILNYIIFAGV